MTAKSTLSVRNRQRARKLRIAALRQMTRHVLESLVESRGYEITVTVIDDPEMTRLNETHLRHQGTTDVITFDYTDPAKPDWLAGDVFVSMGEAVRQAALYKTTWPSEITRYVVHGILHLAGYDDVYPADRRKMKQLENRLVKSLESTHGTAALAYHPTPSGSRTPELESHGRLSYSNGGE